MCPVCTQACPFQSQSTALFFSSCARMERCTSKVMDMDFLWFDSMKRSVEGTIKWQRGLCPALVETGVLTSPWNGTDPALLGQPSQGGGGSQGPVWPRPSPLWLYCHSGVCVQKYTRTDSGSGILPPSVKHNALIQKMLLYSMYRSCVHARS